MVNTTSVGMFPNAATCLWPEDAPRPRAAVYYDLIYDPPEIESMKRGRLAGGEVMDGLGMLVHQCALEFEEWTGRSAPVAVMRQACLDGHP